MTQEKMEELAKAAAHAAVISSGYNSVEYAVEVFIKSYEYAMKKLYEKQQQTQTEANKYTPKTSEDYINGGKSL